MRIPLPLIATTYTLSKQLVAIVPLQLFNLVSPGFFNLIFFARASGHRIDRNGLHADKREKMKHGSVSVATEPKRREFHGQHDRDVDFPVTCHQMIMTGF
jgi:hypothetical protein